MNSFFKLAITIVVLLLIAGCSSPINNTKVSPETQSIITAKTPSPTYTSYPQNVQNSNTVISPTPPVGWEKHTVEEDHFDINVPKTWAVTEKDTSTISSYFLKAVNVKNVKISPMSKILYLESPDSNVSAIITGIEFSNSAGTVSSNSDILTQFLDACIPAVEQSWANAAPSTEIDGTRYENIFIGGAKFDLIPDPDVHNINGYDAKRAAINIANSKGEYLVYCQIFALQNNNRIYFMQVNYINNAASKPAIQTEVSTILGSLNPLP